MSDDSTNEPKPKVEPLRQQLEAHLRKLLDKVQRRHAASLTQLARVEDAPKKAYEAELLKTATSKVKPYDSVVRVMDYALGSEVEIQLQPGQPLQQQIAQRFKQAKRMEAAAEQVLARMAVVEHQLKQVLSWRAELATLSDDALVKWQDKIPPPNLPRRKISSPKGDNAADLPYRIIMSSTGRAIWVGRGAKRNDELTFKHASPHAAWFHASGFSGAHVVVPKRRDEALDAVTEREAALLAAHHSKAPDGALEVTATEVKFVRKPKKAKAGSVIVSRERFVYVVKSLENTKHLMHKKVT